MQYPVLQEPVSFSEEIKKSRFICYLQPVKNLEEAKQFWQQVRAEHPDARHHCWATVAGAPNDSQQYGFSDDGEPSGTAGKPMLNVLLGSGLGEICAVVVRYYGGILLGTGGLVRAYGNGVQQALKLAKTIIKIEREPYQLVCQYPQWAWLEPMLKHFDVEILQQQFTDQVCLTLAIAPEEASLLDQQLNERSAGQLQLQRKED
ncbi:MULTISPECIES: YigZ family protein [Gallibacterium]|uniref:IMPACT family protein n=1 Tax=Gallibacterium genomosp. 3 TaxID=505345 RepID=A0A1A7Q5C5_9PAST|nr:MULTISPECIES: YigZ family protein [Gallibacterium]MDA3978832.1 YigZ family protein [Gallibacterium sp. AGMB14963]OBW92776.1 IMPACT family protein [Gallibacterium genomosp. 3]OBX04060.1 IMPACT family protein [Gallibacterium genomosp. 3]OBX10058.1 IMPACT family protein [Gallibacterium genomosp. 3]